MSKLSLRTKIIFLIVFTGKIFTQTSPHGVINFQCTDCHSTQSWKELLIPLKFNHTETNFQLIGKHKVVACKDCHTDLKFKNTSNNCFSCHKSDFSKTQTPNHERAKFSHDCIACHSNNSWLPITFSHSKTNFQLDGAHQNLDCNNCHKNEKFAGLGIDCFSCHITDFNNVKNPNHQSGKFSKNCLDCHTNISWQPSTFNHSNTNFELTGAHKNTDCQFCHKNGIFKNTQQE